ncbi:hypothetical protein FC70_GL000873 [Paucilactobacillus oligofermentans DSM 15707 = LMG 22743]|uniref:Lipocalin-like domain-containing protein n=1 Tax=Paucilactobacillus oligofermentans DSM 15707 = LMG 22743 TaxID=1423778 RepID=A0A0R1RE31_9LACO|nr:DUF6287 domain-containing protein [Paucilactobacillus oligofermentans]KRL55277.1 hypothetical protein FC70_GL000873 [Paucilactobacillus oligofermentans DSM 15707 = LMG 22743]CUS25732.1 Putative lipoprotein [Paucilactobacillus oligofermentans DSM 15707 = LMG 22743]
MKKFKLIGLIMMALLLIGGCGNQKESAKDSNSTSSTKKHSSSKVKAKKTSSSIQSEQTSESSVSESTTSTSTATAMNFDEISSGNYSSLLGNWKIAATSLNHYDGKGSTWDTPYGTERLDVTSSQISNSDLTMQGTNLISNGETGIGNVKVEDGYLSIGGQTGAINWSIHFYPKGVPNDNWGDDVPTSIDINKDRIFIWTSNMAHTEVFER